MQKQKRKVKHQRHLLNMPKTYPCPICRKTSGRKAKVLAGGHYRCPTHGMFLVQAREVKIK